MIYIESHSTDPAWNLALEQYVFDQMPHDRDYLILWQNHNTIVIGKHQNTAEEIDAAYVKENDITVVRRLSGGGAVYHDLGNINFTFIADAGKLEELNLQKFCVPVQHMLQTLGVQAEFSGRNDITIFGKKFSGNAQYVKNGRVMHHGTLMFDSNLNIIGQVLNANKDKYESKGFQSVKSRVTNIRPYLQQDMSINDFKQVLKERLVDEQQVEEISLSILDLLEIQIIKESRYDKWDWNYGESPAYSVRKKRRFEGCGEITMCMNVEHGRICQAEAYGDFFGDGMTGELLERITGCSLEEAELRKRLSDYNPERNFKNLGVDRLIDLMLY